MFVWSLIKTSIWNSFFKYELKLKYDGWTWQKMNIMNTTSSCTSICPSHMQGRTQKSCSFTAKYFCSLYNIYTYVNSVNSQAWSYQVLWKHSGAVLLVCVEHTRARYTHRIFLWGSVQILQNKNIIMYYTASNWKTFVNIKLYS